MKMLNCNQFSELIAIQMLKHSLMCSTKGSYYLFFKLGLSGALNYNFFAVHIYAAVSWRVFTASYFFPCSIFVDATSFHQPKFYQTPFCQLSLSPNSIVSSNILFSEKLPNSFTSNGIMTNAILSTPTL
jgi:hypothetical protein